jgi:ADP-heptose:LPS heptosyltransferase
VKRAIIIRYGGFGDVVQAASILPHLKSDGWHITWDTSEQGFEILKSDPFVDQLLLTPFQSVSDQQLGQYWDARTNGFDRIINLTGSVENSSLMKPNSFGFFHDDATRRRLYGDVNYVENIHRVAGVPGPFLPRYCPSLTEICNASAALGEKPGQLAEPSIVVGLAGSAEYKIWPHVDDFVALLLRKTEAKVYLAGGPKDAEFAQKLLKNVDFSQISVDRVVDMTSWPVREAYAVAGLANCVVGPETGIVNAVAGAANRKVVLLSHSSPRNLTSHWINTVAIEPGVPCHPCHRLHQTKKFCPRGPSGEFAACAESIDPAQVLAACHYNSEVS